MVPIAARIHRRHRGPSSAPNGVSTWARKPPEVGYISTNGANDRLRTSHDATWRLVREKIGESTTWRGEPEVSKFSPDTTSVGSYPHSPDRENLHVSRINSQRHY
ncbi:Hypothetical protein CINCED_3A009019 [Cinara cedri]|uniref:Uncharacterized protein n=1 Tax=Cinara cedri TaxID=506608 RepID=A0A5E4M4N5_9HEMI|nr:Hypothetical protein CINCED_3A009019 [Cinara cedri]